MAAWPDPAACSAAAAPAMARRTTGVTMPSLSPLSTLTMPPTRSGTVRVAHDQPPQSRIGRGQRRPDEQGQPRRRGRRPARRRAPSPAHGHRERHGEQPDEHGGVRAELAQAHLRRVGEQHPHQGDLGEHLERLGLDVRVQLRHLRQCEPDGDEDDRCGQVGALEPGRERSPAEERRRHEQHGHHACRQGPAVARALPGILRVVLPAVAPLIAGRPPAATGSPAIGSRAGRRR